MKKWRQVAVVMLCLMAALTMTMTADAKTKKKQPSGKVCSGVKWTYNKKSKTLTITGKGYAKITGFYDKSLSSYEWPCSEDSVLPVFTKIKFGEGITQVDYRYFAMEGIKQISLPKSFKKIKYASPVRVNGAYEGWSTTLKKISVNKKNRNFSSSKGVLYSKDKKTIYIYPSGKSVVNYKLSDKVTTIAPYAFYAADMKSIQISSKLTTIGEYAFQYSTVKTVTGGKKLRVIGQMAFYEADGLTNFAFDSALRKIGSNAFYACRLQSVTLPEKLVSVGNCAFMANEELRSLTILCRLNLGEIFLLCTKKMNYSKSEYDYRPITVKLGKNATGPLTTLIDDLGQQITFEVDNANPIYYVKAGVLYKRKGNEVCYPQKAS